MKKYILLLVVIGATACGTTRRKIQQSTSGQDLRITLREQSRKTVTTEIDTMVVVPADSLQATIDLSSGQDTVVRQVTTKEGLSVIASFNRRTQVLTTTARVSEQRIPVKVKQTTTAESDVSMAQQAVATQRTYEKGQTVSTTASVAILLGVLLACWLGFKFFRIIK